MPSIDLNCDLGESVERSRDGTDRRLLDVVSSANIACGGHAGDEETMRQTVRDAVERGAAIGAHPGYPDRENFGRVVVRMSLSELALTIQEQLSRLSTIVRSEGVEISHVKPHGALYHVAMTEMDVADVIAAAAAKIGARFLVGLSGAPVVGWWRSKGWSVLEEAFADRRYEANGSLRARQHEDAMLGPQAAGHQAKRIVMGAGVVASDQFVVPVRADTICIHGDSARAVETSAAVRRELALAGCEVISPRRT